MFNLFKNKQLEKLQEENFELRESNDQLLRQIDFLKAELEAVNGFHTKSNLAA